MIIFRCRNNWGGLSGNSPVTGRLGRTYRKGKEDRPEKTVLLEPLGRGRNSPQPCRDIPRRLCLLHDPDRKKPVGTSIYGCSVPRNGFSFAGCDKKIVLDDSLKMEAPLGEQHSQKHHSCEHLELRYFSYRSTRIFLMSWAFTGPITWIRT